MPEVITDNLDLWTSALLTKSAAGRGSNGKLEAYGIKKLRELIFELAAKGVLVDSKLGTQAQLVRIEDIAELVMGQAPPGADCNKDGVGTVFVKTGEFGDLYPEVVEWTTNPLKLAKLGDVLICVVGATVGKLNLAIDCAIGRSVAAIRPKGGIDTKYLYFALMPYTLRLRSQSRGSAQGVIGKAELNAVEIRLPSEEEQHRIVAKVDELMALCDQLEQQQTDNLAAHQTLVETLLGTLTRIESQQEFSAAWARIATHFDTLFTTEASIDQLKQAILQLAVMGKLVPQDPNDEPACVLLKKITGAITDLVDAGAVKRQKPVPLIANEEEPYEVPGNWAWARLGALATQITDGTHHTPSYIDDGVPFISVKDIDGKRVSFDDCKYISLEEHTQINSRCNPEYGDILICRIGTLGRATIVDTRRPFSLFVSVGLVKFVQGYFAPRFAHMVLHSPLLVQQYEEIKAGGSHTNKLNLADLPLLKIPVAPIDEQHRIVAKVDELMALCDALKERLADAQATQIHLADAIVEQAVC